MILGIAKKMIHLNVVDMEKIRVNRGTIMAVNAIMKVFFESFALKTVNKKYEMKNPKINAII